MRRAAEVRDSSDATMISADVDEVVQFQPRVGNQDVHAGDASTAQQHRNLG
jgi:hypothetical protein